MPIDEKVTKETMDLFTAAEKGDTRKIASLLDDENTNVNWRNQPKGGATALHAAVSKGRDKAAALLIERGAHMHIKTNVDLNTPLHVCCQNGNLTLIKLLVSKGAEINLENQFGNTPVHAACLKGDMACVSFLLDNGSTVDSVNHLKSTPLHFACYNDKQNLELVKYLMSRGASITAEDSEGAIPLQVAATKGHAKICTVLVDAGSDPNHYDAQGRTAVSLALARGHMSLAQVIKSLSQPPPTSPFLSCVFFFHLNAIASFGPGTRWFGTHQWFRPAEVSRQRVALGTTGGSSQIRW